MEKFKEMSNEEILKLSEDHASILSVILAIIDTQLNLEKLGVKNHGVDIEFLTYSLSELQEIHQRKLSMIILSGKHPIELEGDEDNIELYKGYINLIKARKNQILLAEKRADALKNLKNLKERF